MRIGELAKKAGISRDAVRFYEREGLISSQRAENGYREFSAEMLQQLLYVRTAQSLGFSLSESGGGLTDLLRRPSTAKDAQRVLEDKIAMIDARISELRSLRKELHARTRMECPFAVKVTPAQRVKAHPRARPAARVLSAS